MRKAFIISLLTVLALAGCQVNEIADDVSNSKSFTAIIEDSFDGAETRTSLDDNGNVRWKQGDQVSIFAGSTVNEQYQVTDASDGKISADFNKVTGSGFVSGDEIDNNVAFYPYAESAEIAKSGSAYVISDISLPAIQNYAEGSFGNGAFPMAAVTNDTDDLLLKFKNVLGGLKLQLKGTSTITSITVTGNNNEILCGDAEVTTSYGSVPSIALSDASAKTVTLDCGAGVTLDSETATPFIIALPPITMTGGFTVVVTDSESKQMEIKTTKSQTITRSNLLKMPAVNYEGTTPLATPLKFTSTGSTSISLTKSGSPDAISLEYKIDAGEWTSYTIGGSIALADGQEVSFRAGASGNSSFSKSDSNYYKFTISGSGTIAASGNIMSLINKEEGFTIPSIYCFYSLFDGCSSLTTAPELPATTLRGYCYQNMFKGCTSLTTAPELPATTLTGYCYQSMFNGCSSLTTAPELPATTVKDNSCCSMFLGCTSLTTAPPTLPATTLGWHCYQGMFQGCTSLTTAPEIHATTLGHYCCSSMFEGCTNLTTAPPTLPATTLVYYCYSSMFKGCTNLTTAPEIHATTLDSYCCQSMFNGCSSLTTAPELLATDLEYRCYYRMFNGCSNLNYLKALFTTTPSEDYTTSWVSGVSATGTFVKSKDATWDVTGVNGVPEGWTILTDATVSDPPAGAVDLGIMMTREDGTTYKLYWAKSNLSDKGLCTNPEDYGDYYAWGETEPKDNYDWSTYKWCNGDYIYMTKYKRGSNGLDVDNTELQRGEKVGETIDDAARAKLGGKWRMPTVAEWTALREQCTWTWTTNYNGTGVKGQIVTATNGNSIFLPAAGYRGDSRLGLYGVGSIGHYWSSSLFTVDTATAYYVKFNSDGVYGSTVGRCLGLSVRPVSE